MRKIVLGIAVVAAVGLLFNLTGLFSASLPLVANPTFDQEQALSTPQDFQEQVKLGILDENRIRFDRDIKIEDTGDYRGKAKIEWIVDIIPPSNYQFQKDRFLEVFSYDWRRQFPSTFYAYFAATDSWSFAVYADSPKTFGPLELTVPLKDIYDPNEEVVLKNLKTYLKELERRLNAFDVKIDYKLRESLEETVVRTQQLGDFRKEIMKDIVVVLEADTYFLTRQVGHVLVDLGLLWGDGDLFHWKNSVKAIGGDYFFSVWTNTDPGYFSFEDLENRSHKIKDVRFGFSIPRSADPERVFEMMLKAVVHCQYRLGGVLLDENGHAFDKQASEESIMQVLHKLKQEGYKNGQGLILKISF